MVDSSSNSEYSWLLGKKINLNQKVWAIAVTKDSNYSLPADYVILFPGHGFSGPEVVFKEQCCQDMTLTIVQVLTSTSWLHSRVEYVVEAKGLEKYNLPIIINVWNDIKDENLGLDAETFEYLRSKL